MSETVGPSGDSHNAEYPMVRAITSDPHPREHPRALSERQRTASARAKEHAIVL